MCFRFCHISQQHSKRRKHLEQMTMAGNIDQENKTAVIKCKVIFQVCSASLIHFDQYYSCCLVKPAINGCCPEPWYPDWIPAAYYSKARYYRLFCCPANFTCAIIQAFYTARTWRMQQILVKPADVPGGANFRGKFWCIDEGKKGCL